jgi:hypothetical protein
MSSKKDKPAAGQHGGNEHGQGQDNGQGNGSHDDGDSGTESIPTPGPQTGDEPATAEPAPTPDEPTPTPSPQPDVGSEGYLNDRVTQQDGMSIGICRMPRCARGGPGLIISIETDPGVVASAVEAHKNTHR